MQRAQRRIIPHEFYKLLVEATPRFYVTPALVFANVAYFAVTVLLGANPLFPQEEQLWRAGAIFGPLVFDGAWWRIFAAMFVHAGFLHLLLNMWALWILGDVAERMFGNITFLVIYILSGLGGSLGTLLWRPEVTSAGASGAIFGVLGALIAFVQFGRIAVPPTMIAELKRALLIITGLSLAFGLAVWFVDNAAHVGGLLAGLVLGAGLFRSIPEGRRSGWGVVAVPATALTLFGAALWAETRAADDPRVRMAEARPLLAEGRPDAAREKLEEAIALDPDLWEAQAQLGEMAFNEGDYQTAAEALSRAVELDETAAVYRPWLGFAYARLGELEKANAELEKAIEENPDSPLMLSEVAIVQHRLGHEKEAIASLRKAIELDPDNSEHHNRLALVLAESGDREGSRAEVEAALDIEPRGAHIWDSSGTVYFYREEWDEAIKAYRKAIQLDPESAVYHFNLSLALRASGDTTSAEEERARAFELDPDLEPPENGAPIIWG